MRTNLQTGSQCASHAPTAAYCVPAIARAVTASMAWCCLIAHAIPPAPRLHSYQIGSASLVRRTAVNAPSIAAISAQVLCSCSLWANAHSAAHPCSMATVPTAWVAPRDVANATRLSAANASAATYYTRMCACPNALIDTTSQPTLASHAATTATPACPLLSVSDAAQSTCSGRESAYKNAHWGPSTMLGSATAAIVTASSVPTCTAATNAQQAWWIRNKDASQPTTWRSQK